MAENGHSAFEDLAPQRHLREKELIHISDKEGFLCHITLDADFHLTPEQLMTLFSNPDNSGVFRDIYAVPYREVLEDDGDGRQKVTVEQVSGFKFLVVPITFSTHLNVEKNIKKLTFRYWLNKKGLMRKFAGEWFLSPIYSPDEPEKVIGFMKNVSKRAIQRIVEDIRTFTEKFNNGCPLEELLQPVKGKQHESEPEQEPKMSLSDPVE